MEAPLLTKSEHNVDVSIHVDSSSNNAHIINMTADNRSLPTDEQTTHEAEGGQSSDPYTIASIWILIEFVVTLAQIVAAIVVLTLAKNEQRPQKKILILIICHNCASVASLPVLCWRFWQIRQGSNLDPYIKELTDAIKKALEVVFVIWVVVLLGHLIDNFSSLDYTSQRLWLCMVFFAISFIRDVLPNPIYAVSFLLLYFLLPLMAPAMDFIEDFGFNVAYYWIIAAFILGVVACLCNWIPGIVYGICYGG